MPMAASAAPLDRCGESSTPMETWLTEWRRLARTMAWDGTIAFGRLEHCRSPADLVPARLADGLSRRVHGEWDAPFGVSAEASTSRPASQETFRLPD